MDPATIVLLVLFGLAGLIMIVIGTSPDAGAVGSFGGLLLAGVVLVTSASYRNAYCVEKTALITNGLACYVGSPTNSATTFVLIGHDGKHIELK